MNLHTSVMNMRPLSLAGFYIYVSRVSHGYIVFCI